MKRFNPEKELKRSRRKYTKKHLVFSLLGLIGLTILGISFAYYDVNYTSTIINGSIDAPVKIYNKVKKTADGEYEIITSDSFDFSNYFYSTTTCLNGSSGFWNNNLNKVEYLFIDNDECTSYFDADFTIPEATLNLVANSITDTSFSITYTGSDEDSGLLKHELYINNELNQTITNALDGGTISLTGLSADTEYNLKLIAYDNFGNTNEVDLVISTIYRYYIIKNGVPQVSGYWAPASLGYSSYLQQGTYNDELRLQVNGGYADSTHGFGGVWRTSSTLSLTDYTKMYIHIGSLWARDGSSSGYYNTAAGLYSSASIGLAYTENTYSPSFVSGATIKQGSANAIIERDISSVNTRSLYWGMTSTSGYYGNGYVSVKNVWFE